MDDAALVQRAADGDMAAFGAIYDRYAERLHDFFWWVLRDAELTEEALNETFLEAGARIGDLRDPRRLRPWIFAVAGQEAMRYRPPKRGEADPVAPPTGDAAWDGLVALLADVIDSLSPRDRILLDLHFRQGLDGQQLADAIGSKPDDAAMLVESLGQRVERDISATAVAYLGRDRCPALDDLVGNLDDGLDGRTREKVADHVDRCQLCAELRRRRIGPPSLIALSPAPALAPTLRERVLGDVELADHSGRAWPARRLGFPPSLIGGHGRRWRILVAAVLIVLLATGAFLLNRRGRTTDVASVGTTVPSITLPSTSTTSASTTTSSTTPPDEQTGEGGGSTTAGGGGGTGYRPAAGPGRTGGGGGSGGGGGGGGGDTAPAPAPSVPDTTAPPTTAPPVPPDTTGPSLSGLSVSPSTIRSGHNCSGPPATTATVSVQASPPSDVASVMVRVVGLVSSHQSMSGSGGTWTATIGPFGTTPPGGSIPAVVIVTATDGQGNQTTTSTQITLSCET